MFGESLISLIESIVISIKDDFFEFNLNYEEFSFQNS